MEASEVTSAKQWISLPEPEIPVLEEIGDKGAIYEVSKFAYYAASKKECLELGLKADEPNDAMAYILPVAYVRLGKDFELCRLPRGLTSWMLRALLISQRGFDPLPARVGFAIVDGRAIAEILV